MFKKGYLEWKDNNIRVIRRHVLFSTDKKNFDLGGMGCFPHFQTNFAKITRGSASFHKRKSLSTASVTFHGLPSVICSVGNKPDIKFVHSYYQKEYKGE